MTNGKQNTERMPQGLLIANGLGGLIYLPNYSPGKNLGQSITKNVKTIDSNVMSAEAFYESPNHLWVGDNPPVEEGDDAYNLFDIRPELFKNKIRDREGNLASIFSLSEDSNGIHILGGADGVLQNFNGKQLTSYEHLDKKGIKDIKGIFTEDNINFYLNVEENKSNSIYRAICKTDFFGEQCMSRLEKIMELGERNEVGKAKMVSPNEYVHNLDDVLAINGQEIEGTDSNPYADYEAIAVPFADENNIYVLAAQSNTEPSISEYLIDRNSGQVKDYRPVLSEGFDSINEIHSVKYDSTNIFLESKSTTKSRGGKK